MRKGRERKSMSDLLLGIMGFSFGVLSAAGVFTVLVAVGLVPRFAGKTHTGRYVTVYEEMVVAGTVTGCFLSVFPEFAGWSGWLQDHFPQLNHLWNSLGYVVLILFGLFCGMFVGCLALAIAEMLDSIPIFTRRIRFRKGIGLVLLSIAAGKLAGSLFYFLADMGRLVK